MATKSKGFHIDRRVAIAWDALTPEQRRSVDRVIGNKETFLAHASDPANVRKLSGKTALYTLRVPPGLRIVFSKTDDEIVVMDVMRKATLDHFKPH
jgi:hypothetical protein